MKIFACFLSFTIICSSAIFAQQPANAVRFLNGPFITGNNTSNQLLKKEVLAAAAFQKKYFVLVQFDELPSKGVRESLKQAGIELHTYLPGKAYLATIGNDFNFTLTRAFNISSINVVPSIYKIDPELLNGRRAPGKKSEKKVALSFFPAAGRETVIQQLLEAGAVILPVKYNQDDVVFIQADHNVVNAIAALPFVTGVYLQSLTDKLLNYNDVGAHGISGLNALNGKNLNGDGVTVGIGDNADISTHIDFAGRLINRNPSAPQDHGTHVAGTLAGAGILNIKNHGMAPKATLISQYFSDIITSAPVYITDNRMVLTNNSYYSAEDGCAGNGAYDLLSNFVDKQVGKYPALLHVIAAGNDGAYTCSPFPQSFATVKSGWQTAKNVLTVGAINTSDYSVANFSSRGPVQDGRIKPEIMAGGWGVTSTTTSNTYGVEYGTSMASPVVTGALALMYERYRQVHAGADPRSALIKALACNTAEDLGNPGPDYTYGFGMLNARRAVEAIDSNRFFVNAVTNRGSVLHMINIPINTRRIKVMLYWADTAAATNAAAALVNDLDLTVSGPSSVLHYPLVLNPSPLGVNNIAAEGIDHVNNIEQVIIENPPAGTYTIKVNGYIIPFSSQEYVISYDIIKPSVVVEYPAGGEKLVPEETENIRWSAYGSEAYNFTAEYSVDGGLNWTIINNNISAADRKLPWIIPTEIATNRAQVRVSRNGTSLSGRSSSNFSILGRPVVTAVNVCEGAVQLNWGAIAGVTAYDVLQLTGDSMKVIGNTTGTSYIVEGLNKSTIAWLGVAAKNGSVAGRRSISVSILPGSGPCTLASFNNDVKIDTILEPASARQGFTNAGDATRPVKILIRNLGAVAVSGPFNVSYRYANITITETINTVIAPHGSYNYTFSGAYPIVPAGFRYDFKSWVSSTSDNNHLNDTAYKTVKYINNDAITAMPVKESFESLPDTNFRIAEMAIGGNKRFDFSTSSARGRARSFVNTGFAFSGKKAITLDQTPFSNSPNTDSLTINYNLSNYASKQLRFDFYYKNHGQEYAPGNKVWMRGSENSVWVPAYDLFANQAAPGNWKQGIININEVLSNAVPPQAVTNTFQVKIGEEGKTSANNVNPVTDIDDGYTLDEITLAEALYDIGIIKINSPDISGCSLGPANPIGIRIKNYNNISLNNIPVSYRVNSGSIITENIASVAPNQTIDYTFTQPANLAAYTDYTINVWVQYPADNYAANDSMNIRVHNSPLISSYPYLQNFEAGDGNFYTGGTNSSWAWGVPSKAIIHKAASGLRAWVTNLTGDYNNNETAYLYSPCFDIHALVKPVLSFSHLLTTELNYDYSWAEYSTDGIVWQKLGNPGAGTNWYDDASSIAWKGGNTDWHIASIDLPLSLTNIRLRFVLNSDAGVTDAGIGIDDIHIFDKAPVYTGEAVTAITQNVSGSNWVHFSAGGNRIVSLNANGANLGATVVQAYPYSGSVRNSNNQYYANRNIVVRPYNLPAGNVGVRFYFTEDEARNLVGAEGCSLCLKPADPYELGVTKYSGTASDENEILDDDTTGVFQYILPANTVIVPYDNGYYAEFEVNSFSEFWLSSGNIKPASGGVCLSETIVFTADAGAGSYQWQENNGSGYVNLNNSVRYSGAQTPELQLINLPSAFSGYRYRCIMNGIAGKEHAVKFTNIWSGSAGTNWFIAANWSCGIVPDQYTDVIIPRGITDYPVVNANTMVKSIRIHPGASVTVSNTVQLHINGR